MPKEKFFSRAWNSGMKVDYRFDTAICKSCGNTYETDELLKNDSKQMESIDGIRNQTALTIKGVSKGLKHQTIMERLIAVRGIGPHP